MESSEQTRLARAWLEVQRNWWAWDQFEKLVETEPRLAFAILGTLIDLADDEDLLGDIGAGPLEDFLRKHGSLFIDDLEHRAAADHRWRSALASVWLPAAGDATTLRLERLGCTLLTTRGEPGDG